MKSRWCIGFLALGLPLAAWAGTMQVQVGNGIVRAQPSSLGKPLGTLPYGQMVQTLATQGSWVQIQLTGGQTGWMPVSALSSKRITVKQTAGTASANASADDLALAGKGFSASIENEFKRQNPSLSFAPVDRMEKDKASTVELQRFIQDGGLNQPGSVK